MAMAAAAVVLFITVVDFKRIERSRRLIWDGV
jgi:hypothetical protein